LFSPFFRYFAVRPAMGHVRKDIAVPSHSDNILPETEADVNINLQYLRQKSKNLSARFLARFTGSPMQRKNIHFRCKEF
jgi:hypothetical protein